MELGINAFSNKWFGALVKQDFLHHGEKQDKNIKALSFQYQGLSHEIANKEYHWGEHLHEDLEIIFIEKGFYACELNGHSLELNSGDVLIIGPGDIHSDFCRPPLEYYALWFDIIQMTEGSKIHLLRDNIPPEQQLHSLSNSFIIRELKRLYKEEQLENRFSLPLQQAMAEEIIWRLLSDIPENRLNPLLVKHSRESELLVRLTRLFEKNLDKTMTVSEMANGLNMSESSLAHSCTELLGISPARALIQYRIEKAEQMLLYSKLSVKEISSELGFNDSSHFINAFQRERGCTPGLFRRKTPSAS